ncbi:nuclear transport factor 2 family protein [Myxococcus fulvus]|uniref:nuclear transport factor 2 family protein n=1 Tax=Myxococcus fulvus TaxID=33 RepID=UPI003B9DAE9B
MSLDEEQVRDFARRYAEAWCSGEPTQVAAHYVPGGGIAINGGTRTGITEAARSFMEAFPDIHVSLDDVVIQGEHVEFHWTLTGTNTGPGGTGKPVRISGFEAWRLGADGRVVEATGTYDANEYHRQLGRQ